MNETLLRTSERSLFKQCRQRWAWAYLDGYRSPYSSPALQFGSLAHEALAAYYVPGRARGPHPARTFETLYRGLDASFRVKDEEEGWVDALEIGIAMFEHYVEVYGADGDIEVIAPEMPFRVELKDAGGAPFWYVGRFDALVYFLDWREYGIFEHKTATTISTRHLTLDEQAGSYWAFAPVWIDQLVADGILKGRHRRLELDHILYNFMRKAKPDPRPTNAEGRYLNKDGSVSRVQPPAFFERVKVYRSADDRASTLKRIRQEAWEMRQVREGRMPIYKNPSSGYPDRHCETCPFYDMCELEEARSDWRSVAQMSFTQVDPYEEYMRDLGFLDEKEVS